jgi:hypothetical protein
MLFLVANPGHLVSACTVHSVDRDRTQDKLHTRHLTLAAAAAHCLVADPGRLAKVSAPALFLVGDRDRA